MFRIMIPETHIQLGTQVAGINRNVSIGFLGRCNSPDPFNTGTAYLLPINRNPVSESIPAFLEIGGRMIGGFN
jgi:hypothetical protein